MDPLTELFLVRLFVMTSRGDYPMGSWRQNLQDDGAAQCREERAPLRRYGGRGRFLSFSGDKSAPEEFQFLAGGIQPFGSEARGLKLQRWFSLKRKKVGCIVFKYSCVGISQITRMPPLGVHLAFSGQKGEPRHQVDKNHTAEPKRHSLHKWIWGYPRYRVGFWTL